MSCGVLVMDLASPYREDDTPSGDDHLPSSPGHDLAELLRSAGHSVVECDPPQDEGTARGVVEAAWVVLTGVDLLVIVDDPACGIVPTGSLCDRARELMTDRGPGGAIVRVPPGVPLETAAACLLDLADSFDADAAPLEVEPVPPRADLLGGPRAEASRAGVPVAGSAEAMSAASERAEGTRPGRREFAGGGPAGGPRGGRS